jgi:PAS domain S-box-containing protein
MTTTGTSTTRNAAPSLVALKKIVEGISDHTGEVFFQQLVKNLAEVLDVHGVWVTEYLKDKNRLRALAFWLNDHFVDEYEYDVPGTPCEPVLENQQICHVPDRVIELYPKDPDLPSLDAVSYMGLALRDEQGKILGHLALLDNKPMKEIPEVFAIFKIFTARAAAEMRRLGFEKKLIENESKLKRLVNGTSEALIEINESFMITQANEAALKSFKSTDENFIGRNIKEFFDPESLQKVLHCMAQQGHEKNHYSTIIPGQLTCIRADKKTFPAESTISKYSFESQNYHAIFLRNVKDRLKDQEKLKLLNTETVMLREKVSVHNFDDIIGESPEIIKALKAVSQVAPAESSVLIHGETGTGKELFAQAIHKASNRKSRPIVTLNCAALPVELVESELFGHVKGAFTGAVSAREGRFALADGGTIFLDEIGELPLPLQAKLLRVLQEGEFEPVGSSKTQKVNVRVVAATNRNLEDEILKGKFRQDLYYRLNVFPIYVPPLRQRGNDIILLAEAFLKKYGRSSSLKMASLNEADKQRLLCYHWPGNVRELQNIIERCVITSVDGKIDLPSILPNVIRQEHIVANTEVRILNEQEMIAIEKQNIIRALEMTNWKISGEGGAAELLQIPSTTLSSRIRKFRIAPGK